MAGKVNCRGFVGMLGPSPCPAAWCGDSTLTLVSSAGHTKKERLQGFSSSTPVGGTGGSSRTWAQPWASLERSWLWSGKALGDPGLRLVRLGPW